jgi:hypothetical protein
MKPSDYQTREAIMLNAFAEIVGPKAQTYYVHHGVGMSIRRPDGVPLGSLQVVARPNGEGFVVKFEPSPSFAELLKGAGMNIDKPPRKPRANQTGGQGQSSRPSRPVKRRVPTAGAPKTTPHTKPSAPVGAERKPRRGAGQVLRVFRGSSR